MVKIKKGKNTFKSLIEGQDLFGHVIQFNFNRKGDSHRTLIGAFVSILIKLSIAYYIFIKVLILVSNGDDKISTEYTLHKLEEGEDPTVHMNETNVFQFMVIRKQTANSAPLWLNETLDQYLKFGFK